VEIRVEVTQNEHEMSGSKTIADGSNMAKPTVRAETMCEAAQVLVEFDENDKARLPLYQGCEIAPS
jgi:hypothetical protein